MDGPVPEHGHVSCTDCTAVCHLRNEKGIEARYPRLF